MIYVTSVTKLQRGDNDSQSQEMIPSGCLNICNNTPLPPNTQANYRRTAVHGSECVLPLRRRFTTGAAVVRGLRVFTKTRVPGKFFPVHTVLPIYPTPKQPTKIDESKFRSTHTIVHDASG
jgi:hypothetical protein